jgi:hypothetical protein
LNHGEARDRCHAAAAAWNTSHTASVFILWMRGNPAVPEVARPVLCGTAEVRVLAKGLPLFAGLIGVAAPVVALSGLVPSVASPVLLAVGVIAALALSRGESGSPR